jgi:hypothetical protein
VGAALTRELAFYNFQEMGVLVSDQVDVVCDLLHQTVPMGEENTDQVVMEDENPSARKSAPKSKSRKTTRKRKID